MNRGKGKRLWAACGAACMLGSASVIPWASGADFRWTNTSNMGHWFDVANNWALVSGIGVPPPGPGDNALFNQTATYTVLWDSFTGDVTNANLNVTAGNVTFYGSEGPFTYTLTSGVLLQGGDLSLGRLAGDPHNMQINGQLVLRQGSNFTVRSGSAASAGLLRVGDVGGTSGTVRVTGAGSVLGATGLGEHRLGLFGGAGHLIVENGATGSIAGTLRLGETADANTIGNAWVLSGATLNAPHLSLGNAGVSGQRGAIHVHGDGSRLMQTGASTLVVGAANNSEGVVTIGVTSGDASTAFTTGTGNITINRTGSIAIGGNLTSQRGTFNANGHVMVNGGTLSRGSAGVFNLAAGRNLTATSEATISFAGSYTVGGGSSFGIYGGSTFSTTSFLDIGGLPSSSGTMIIDGMNSKLTVTAAAFSRIGASGSTGSLIIRDDATAEFTGALRLADQAAGNVTGSLTVDERGRLEVGTLWGGTGGGAGSTGTINVQNGGRIEQSGAAQLVLGAGAGSAGVLNVGTTGLGLPGHFTGGTGGIIVHPTGAINVGSPSNEGWFSARGDVMLNGGTLNVTGMGRFNMSANRFFTAVNGASATFANLGVGEGQVYQIQSGSSLTVAGMLWISDAFYSVSPFGTLVIDGPGTMFHVAGDGVMIPGGDARGSLTLRNGAAGTIAEDLFVFNAAAVQSGASLNVGNRLVIGGTFFYEGGTITAGTVELVFGGRMLFSPGGGKTLTANQVSIDSAEAASYIDLADNQMIIRNTPLAQVHAYVASGHAGGNWNGPGINSSVAAVEMGRAVGVRPQGEHVLVRFTWGGDATLDGVVNVSDLSILAANWQQSGRLWHQGDFNFDGVVNISDLSILAGNWQAGASGGAGMSFEEAMGMFDAFEGVVVPEPGVAGIIGLVGLLLSRRRT